MNILGISAYYHDSAAALVQDGTIVAAAQEERFTRKKHDAGFPLQAIRYCLMVVGEALYWVPADILTSEPLIPWRQVIALRRRLVHGYWLIDEDLIVEIARHDTEALIGALARLIEKIK